MNKRGASTLTGLVITLILVISMFSGFYLYLEQQADEVDLTLDPKYNDTYNRLQTSRDELEDNVDEIKDDIENIEEATSIYQVAWNGLKSLGSTLKLSVNFLGTAITTFQAMLIPLDILPAWAIAGITIGIIAFIVFLVLSILKGDPRL